MRLPSLTPGSPPIALPAIQPGAEITTPDVFILENRRRNAGLQGDARTNTDRARQAARRADPDVTNTVSDSEWRAHHLIPLELVRSGDPVLRAALRGGWKTDEDANMAAVPNSPAALEKLRRAGISRPVDDSGHSYWNNDVKDRLARIDKDLDRALDKPDTSDTSGPEPARDELARSKVEELMSELRRELIIKQRITESGGNSGSSNAERPASLEI